MGGAERGSFSRGDFLRDEKWPMYLPYCNQLYFVAPKEVISRDEVPAECGLLEVSKNFKRLVTRKKAPRREIEFPEPVFRYVLMRSRIVSEANSRGERNYEFWRDWLKEKREKQEVGWQVRDRIASLVASKVERVQKRNAELEQRIQDCETVERIMESVGIKDLPSWELRREAERMLMKGATEQAMTALLEVFDRAERAIKTLKGPSDAKG